MWISVAITYRDRAAAAGDSLAPVSAGLSLLLAAGLVAAQPDAGAPDAAAPPPANALATPAEIDKACNAAEKRAFAHLKDAAIFADVSEEVRPKAGQGTWRRFASSKELKNATAGGPPNTQASVWPAVGGGVLFIELFFQSDSGDWAQYADLCYRPDGSLARTADIFNTFDAGDDDRDAVSRIHTLHFDGAGQAIRSRSKLLDLKTRKPVKRGFVDEKEMIFMHVADLPFSDLLVAQQKGSVSSGK
jgi:hypothetical protein